MKTLKNFLLMCIVLSAATANAQNAKDQKLIAFQKALKNGIETKNYTFIEMEQRSVYRLRVTRDSVIAFLPYRGDAHRVTAPGIKFTSTNFYYKLHPGKKGRYQITIIPNGEDNAGKMILMVSAKGNATLTVNSPWRDPISFDGFVMGNMIN